MDRHWDENPKVLVFYSQWGKLFAINLLLTTKQYKVDNIVNFVYYGKTRIAFFSFEIGNLGSFTANVQQNSSHESISSISKCKRQLSKRI